MAPARPADPLLLSPGQAGDRLGVGRSAIYHLVRAGRLRAVRPLSDTGELRFRDADLVAFVATLEAVDPAAIIRTAGAVDEPAAGGVAAAGRATGTTPSSPRRRRRAA
jgi:excisionase family DNA binding protein